jgi:cell division inhibitor SulA/protein ImuA
VHQESGLSPLLRHPGLWRAREPRRRGPETIATGFPTLDRCLPGGGWPMPALVEILHDVAGLGELGLLLPALSRLLAAPRLLACIAPPHVLCIPALEARGVPPARLLVVDVHDPVDVLWAGEQALRSAACSAVLLWLTGAPVTHARRGAVDDRARALRRLQLAAETGRSLGVVFRPLEAATHASPAALRLALHAASGRADTPCLELLKSRGGVRRRIPLDGTLR